MFELFKFVLHIYASTHISRQWSLGSRLRDWATAKSKGNFLALSVCSLETVADFELTWQSINFNTEGPSLHFAKLWNSVRRTSWLGRECEVEGKSKACNQLPIMSHCLTWERGKEQQAAASCNQNWLPWHCLGLTKRQTDNGWIGLFVGNLSAIRSVGPSNGHHINWINTLRLTDTLWSHEEITLRIITNTIYIYFKNNFYY